MKIEMSDKKSFKLHDGIFFLLLLGGITVFLSWIFSSGTQGGIKGKILDQDKDAFFEGNPFIPAKLSECKELQKIPTLKVFLSPLSQEEILFLKDPSQRTNLEELLPDIMRRKLLRRTKRQKINLSLKDLENIEKRVASAIVELREAWKFDYVIPNHDGEDSEHWDAFYYPIGDARKALQAFAALLQGEIPPGVEYWEKDLVP